MVVVLRAMFVIETSGATVAGDIGVSAELGFPGLPIARSAVGAMSSRCV